MHYHLITVLVTRVEKWVSERERKRGMDRPVERERGVAETEGEKERDRETGRERQTDKQIEIFKTLFPCTYIILS